MSEESTSQALTRAETDALAAWQAVPYAVSHQEAQRISREYLDAARKEFEEQIGQLPQARQSAARQAERKLNVNGWEVYPVQKWWGFEIVLNAEAAKGFAEIMEGLGDILGALPGPLGPLIEFTMKIRAAIIQAIGSQYGCRLVSPWVAPLMLIPLSLAPKSDTSLWWTVMNDSHVWSQDEKFPGHLSASTPALAEYNGKLYCVHRGDQDSKLWWTVYDPDPDRSKGWSTDTALPGHMSSRGPGLAVYNNQLYCVHRGAGNDQYLWWTRFNGTSWSTDIRMSGATTHAPALASFRGMLYCVYKDSKNNRMWQTRFNGTSWDADKLLPAHETSSNPALAVYNDRLYCVHRGGGYDQGLWWTRFDGTNWSTDTKLPGQASQEGPALAVHNNHLYCVYRSMTNDPSLYWCRFNYTSWNPPTRLPNHMSLEGPAIASYRDPNATENQLFCVHRGS